MPYISVCDTNLPQELCEKKGDNKTITNKNLIYYLLFLLLLFTYQILFSIDCDCWRSRSKSPYHSSWSLAGAVDAIDFQTNGDVILQGYRLWGVSSGSTTYQVTIRLYRGSSLIAEKTGSYSTSSRVKTFAVHFSQGISVRAGLLYTATAKITTSKYSFAHNDGTSSASCSGVTVTFKKSSKSNNGSNLSNGLIPALIFRSRQCQK